MTDSRKQEEELAQWLEKTWAEVVEKVLSKDPYDIHRLWIFTARELLSNKKLAIPLELRSKVLQSHFLAETSTATIEASEPPQTKSRCKVEKSDTASVATKNQKLLKTTKLVANPRPLEKRDEAWDNDNNRDFILKKAVLGMVEWLKQQYKAELSLPFHKDVMTQDAFKTAIRWLDKAVRNIR